MSRLVDFEMRHRIVIGVDIAPIGRSRLTGTERYALEVVGAMLRHPRSSEADWRLYQRSHAAQDRLMMAAGGAAAASHVQYRTLGEGRLWTHLRLGREVSQAPPTVLFVPAHVLPVALPWRSLPASVVTLHDVGYRRVPEGHTWQQRAYLDWSTRDAVRRAAAVIAVSRATADDLYVYYGAAEDRLRVIHEAPSPVGQVTSEVAQRVYERFGIDRPYALYMGSIQPRKNLARLVEAFAQLHARGQAEFDLVLAGGEGWLAESVHQVVDASGVGLRVRLIGYVSEEERAVLLRGARLFCYPSLAEGFGLPVLEAQSAGVPVLTANNSSLPEVAGDGALLVDATNVEEIARAMLQLSRDEELRSRLIAAGSANVKRFSWQRAADETLAVLLAVAAGTKPG